MPRGIKNNVHSFL